MHLEGPSAAKRADDSLIEIANRLEFMRGGTDEDLPAWLVLTPAGEIRIRFMGLCEPFLQFTGPDGERLFIASEPCP